MEKRYNPFSPNQLVHVGMFVGRLNEIDRIDEVLVQTKNENPRHILLIGERGIGKSSLLLLTKTLAKGDFRYDGSSHNFLTIHTSLTHDMDLVDFAHQLSAAIERELNKENRDIARFKKAWDFLKNFRVGGISFDEKEKGANQTSLINSLKYSISDTLEQLTNPDKSQGVLPFKKKDGVVILIDEADKASKNIALGEFLKSLTEFLQIEGNNRLLLVIAGLPPLRQVLLDSHESSLRVFEEFEISPLSRSEVKEVIIKGIDESNSKLKRGEKLTIEPKALDSIYVYSEGYPHFVQQIGASVLDHNDDDIIDVDDVKRGFFISHGALDLIGNVYYKKIYYRDINVDSYREVLQIMAEKWNTWISRDEINKKFSGGKTTLNNAIKTLKDRNIILVKEGSRGLYRLQWASFAFWIKFHSKQKQLELFE